MTLGLGHNTSLGHVQHLCEILSTSNMAVRIYDSDMDFGYVEDMTLGQGHDTRLDHLQQFCEILSRSEKGARSYCPDTM